MTRCPGCSGGVPDGARFCPECGAALVADSRTPTRLAEGDASPEEAPTRTARPGGEAASRFRASAAASDSIHHGRFVPGAILGGRYRIVGLLGRGGMGEVYRADDLKLGQPVALKLLPERLAADPGLLARFHNEVRLARQVSHPNVCRVYDIGEADGIQFLSMEYIDGEDLATLLRRIGRLPQERAVEIARQICAGLAAAHDRGVLHRDLKPANVMLDGRGRARITDFGLAGIAGDPHAGDLLSGTPIYMAPEQLAGREVSVRSDLYSLGLTLFELFTGRSAWKAGSLAELRRLHEEISPASPSSLVAELDPAVERAILRCLEHDPEQRPASALAVAASLPGGDPLAAALAAGETPSPEMVAAAQVRVGLSTRAAWGLFAAVLVAFAGVLLLAQRTNRVNLVPLEKGPEVLLDRAREMARTLAPPGPIADEAWGFASYAEGARYHEEQLEEPGGWEAFRSGSPPVFLFWYRRSPEPLVSQDPLSVVTGDSPPLLYPGEARLVLDPSGRLLELQVVPAASTPGGDTAPASDWGALFGPAGIDPAGLREVQPRRTPPFYCEARRAWEEASGHAPARRFEAGSVGGRPIYFRVDGPWSDAGASIEPGVPARVQEGIRVTLLAIALAFGAHFARRNLASGRGDRRGALRLAAYFVAMHVAVWLLWADHARDPGTEWLLFGRSTGWTMFNAGMIWIYYLALEPFVRRHWPDTLVSWSRILAGRFRDPLVGRDLMVGVLMGMLTLAVDDLASLAEGLTGRGAFWPDGLRDDPSLNGLRDALGSLLDIQLHAVLDHLQYVLLFFLLRSLLKRTWLAAVCFVALGALAFGLGNEVNPFRLLVAVYGVSAFTFVLVRFGILAAVFGAIVAQVLDGFPLTIDPSRFFFASSTLAVAAVAAFAAFGLRAALAGLSVPRAMHHRDGS